MEEIDQEKVGENAPLPAVDCFIKKLREEPPLELPLMQKTFASGSGESHPDRNR